MTEQQKQPTCEERIGGELEGRLSQIAALIAIADESATDEQRQEFAEDLGTDATGESLREEAIEALEQLPLGVSKCEVYTVQLSWGGPSDEFEVTYDRENDEVTRIEYVFKDWFDGARRTVDSQAFDTIERFARQLTADFYTE